MYFALATTLLLRLVVAVGGIALVYMALLGHAPRAVDLEKAVTLVYYVVRLFVLVLIDS
jgi:hypothetical protein